MAAKEVIFDTRARESILRGVNTLADAVKATLGPRGRTAPVSKIRLNKRISATPSGNRARVVS